MLHEGVKYGIEVPVMDLLSTGIPYPASGVLGGLAASVSAHATPRSNRGATTMMVRKCLQVSNPDGSVKSVHPARKILSRASRACFD